MLVYMFPNTYPVFQVSYLIGYGLFSDYPSMWLGLFLTGCSPGGGGSNMWTYLLDGSLDLSVTMTFVSTVGAFAALPIWVFSLARTIFNGEFYMKSAVGRMIKRIF